MTAWPTFDARHQAPGPRHVRFVPAGGRKVVYWDPGLGGHDLADLVYIPFQRLTMPARLVITEGERAADAVMAAGVLAIGTVCGSGTVPGPAVARLLTGCRVTLWPDADAPGRHHMGQLASLLESFVAAMAVVDLPPSVPPGWDAADATPAQVRRLVATAHDVWLARR